jgi:NAD(P)-dependent dehydrogenase (short-subunit alcohol dehydrogenase family)
MNRKFEGKTSIITGASSGIGRATVIEFSKLGSQLVIIGRNEEELDKTIELCDGTTNKSENVLKIVGDLVDIETCKRAIEECIKKFNKLDHLVNILKIRVLTFTIIVKMLNKLENRTHFL